MNQNPAYETFVQIFTQYEPALRSFVRGQLPTWEDVDEVMQQTCLVLWRKYGDFEPASDFLAWSCTIARFEVLKYRRTQARDRHIFNEELLSLLADEALSETQRLEEERHALDRCVEKLPPDQRELIRRCYAAGISIKDVAETLGRSATSLYKALHRIRLSLLDCIERALAEGAS